MQTPVLLTVFRRLETVKPVLAAIRAAAPPRLYVAADGPRADRPGEDECCRQVREYVLSQVDWPCRVETRFRPVNLGCGPAMTDALDWFFAAEPEGIVIEDDCVLQPEFFTFCEAALAHYREEPRVMSVGALNPLDRDFAPRRNGFSRYAQLWGWGSWRRAWRLNDFHLDFDFSAAALEPVLGSRRAARRWEEILRAVKAGAPGFDTWDFQWAAALMRYDGLAAVPGRNLVCNVGFADPSHDLPAIAPVHSAAAGWEALPFADDLSPDREYDRRLFELCYAKPPLLRRVLRRLRRLCRF